MNEQTDKQADKHVQTRRKKQTKQTQYTRQTSTQKRSQLNNN